MQTHNNASLRTNTLQPLGLSVTDAANALGVSHRMMQKLVARGDIASIKIARRRVVPVKALQDYIDEKLTERS